MEISSYSFGHFGWSDLREKNDCRQLCHDVCEVATRFASFCGNRFQDVFDLHDSAMVQCVTVSLIDDEHASDLVQAVCVDSSSDYTCHGPCYESQEGRNEGNERSEGDDQGSAFG